MAVFFDYPIQSPGLGTSTHHEVAWHSQFALLAVASKNESSDADGTVHFFLDEGHLVEDASIQRSVVVECLLWHPEREVIAIGWRSGEITTYNNHDHEFFEQSSIHRAPISVLQWNKTGSRLVSGDKSGLLVVWKVEANAQLHPAPLHQHRLPSPITHCAMLTPPQAGDPGGGSVLDAYSWQRKSAMGGSTDSFACFCTSADGAVCFLNNSGEWQERFQADSPVHSLLLQCDRQTMAVLTHDMVLTQFSVSLEGKLSQATTAKLSGKSKATSIISVADGVLASCSVENVIRFWDLDHGDNYMLDLHQCVEPVADETVTDISFNQEKGILAAGTSTGNVVMWQWRGGRQAEGAEKWEFLASSSLAAPVLQVKWGSRKHLLAANTGTGVQILREHILCAHFNSQVSAVQVSPSDMLVVNHVSDLVSSIKSDIHVKGTFVSKEYVAIWSGRKMVVYGISQDKSLVRVAGSFSTETEAAVIYEHSIYTSDRNQVTVRAFQGTVKQLLACGDPEGSPTVLGVSGHFLVAGTDAGWVKVWDLSRREARLHCSKCLSEQVPDFSKILSISCNSNASRISVVYQQANRRCNQLLLWDLESDALKLLNIAALRAPTESLEPSEGTSYMNATFPELADATLSDQLQLCGELLGRQPVSHHWGEAEPKLLAVAMADDQESGLLISEAGGGAGRRGRERGRETVRRESRKYAQSNTVVVVMFVTQDLNILLSDVKPVEPALNSLIGIHVPFLYFSRKAPSQTLGAVARVTLQDFVGLEGSDTATLQAMMEFSYHSSVGNMDEAFKAIKLIKSESVWENMARMCVKTQRLDVAAVCLGNMGNARAARAVREAQAIPEPEARLAELAVQLGMLEEAEELYKRSKRYDLLNKFYQASGKWTKAIGVAELQDRMHLRTTYYNYARHTEGLGEFPAAISSYEKSGTHHVEVPRMLLDDPLELENYVMKSKDRAVRKWWAEYLESVGEWEQAMQFYETAKDYFSLVRILCFNGNYDRAMEVVEESGSRAAAYQLARRLSADSVDVKKAIHFYKKAQCYSPALQLAKEHDLEDELMGIALLSTQEDMMEAAKYYEESPDTQDKAIMLYHKAGEVSKALELCFQHRRFEVLHKIAEDLSEDASPEMINRVADYFTQHDQFGQAVELLIRSQRISEAVDLCTANSITITEELAERMTIAKAENESPEAGERRVRLLEKLAECCASQGSYHLATKKYTQAGNKTKAMKALLKSGDTEKIVFFAGVSRQKDIYVMAANYLQTLDWRKDPEIMKNIISFYTKGRAMESLAGFYDACAQVEIDEYQNYGKAVGALNEALKCLGKAKSKNPATLEAKVNFLKERIELVTRFAEARRVYEEDPEECLRQCLSLLDEPQLDTAIRTGDVYGLMIEHYGQTGNFEKAYSLMQEMRQRIPTVNMAYYVDIRTIETIHSTLGIPLGRGMGAELVRAGEGEEQSEGEDSVGEEVEEEGY